MGALSPGQLLEGTSYQVVRELGAGGMGIVYEIEHIRLKKRYVAKVIHEQIRHDEGAAKRMEREAQVLAAISHPNIVQVHDVGTTPDGVSYFVMEKLEGVDLRRAMKQHSVRRVRSIEIVTDVLDALAYVHARGMVHRDIKPENIFLAEQLHRTVTKVLDFGIVHIFDRDGRASQNRITKTGGFVGTLYYAAPEQMQGKAAGPPNDVYAAGLVLFELLAGKGPFDDDPGVGLSRCFKAAPRLIEFVPTATRALDDAVARALEMDPARRPTASELAAELRKVAAAMKAAPGAAEDEAIRAEVDDLLRRMAPLEDGPPRPAAGRIPTPAPAVDPSPSIVAAATAAPPTPVMAGAPGRVPSGAPAPFDATLASPTGEPIAGGQAPSPVAGPVPPEHMQNFARISSSAYPNAPPGAPAVTGGASTSPGLYATVDDRPAPSVHVPARTPWAALAAAGGAILLTLVLIGGAVLLRTNDDADGNASSSPASSVAAAAAAASSASVSTAPTTEPSTAPSEVTTAVASAPTASSSMAPATTATAAVPKAKATATSVPSSARPAAPPPPARSTTAAAPSPAKTTAPRGASTAHVDKNGYVKSF